MKRLISIILLFALMLTGCNGTSKKVDNVKKEDSSSTIKLEEVNTIKLHKFSKNTEQILSAFEINKNLKVFDFNLDDTIKSAKVKVWIYKDGKWIEEFDSAAFIDEKQIRFMLCDNKYMFSCKGVTSKVDTKYVQNEKAQVNYSAVASEPVKIEIGKEIPLWFKVDLKNASDPCYDIDQFKKSNCYSGIALTVTFSDKEETRDYIG